MQNNFTNRKENAILIVITILFVLGFFILSNYTGYITLEQLGLRESNETFEIQPENITEQNITLPTNYTINQTLENITELNETLNFSIIHPVNETNITLNQTINNTLPYNLSLNKTISNLSLDNLSEINNTENLTFKIQPFEIQGSGDQAINLSYPANETETLLRSINFTYNVLDSDDNIFNCTLWLDIDDAGYDANTTAYNTSSDHNYSDKNDDCVLNMWFEQNASDISSNGNDGTWYNEEGDEDVTGKVYYAYEFDGIDDYIGISHSTDFNLGTNVTLAMWIKPNTCVTGGDPIAYLIRKNTPGVEHKTMYLNTACRPSCYFHNIGYINALSTDNLTLNKWSHVVCTYNGSDGIIYVDGIKSYNLSLSGNIADSNGIVSIGIDADENDDAFNGSLDEILWFNISLSSGEISDIYNKSSNFIEENINHTFNKTFDSDDHTINWKVGCYDENSVQVNASAFYLSLISPEPEEPDQGIPSSPAPTPAPAPAPTPLPQPEPQPTPVPEPPEQVQQEISEMNFGPGFKGILQNLLFVPIIKEPRQVIIDFSNNTVLINLQNETEINIDITEKTILIQEKITYGEKPQKPSSLIFIKIFIYLLVLAIIIILYYLIKLYLKHKTIKIQTKPKLKSLTQDIDTYKINKLIFKSNKLSESIKLNINKNKLHKASKQYEELLNIYKYLILKLKKQEKEKLYKNMEIIYNSLKHAIEISYFKEKLTTQKK